MRVGLAAERGRGAGEQLRPRCHLGMDFESDDHFPVARRAPDEFGVCRLSRHRSTPDLEAIEDSDGDPHAHQARAAHAPRRLLDRLAEREQRLLVERTADQLQPERQPLARQARGRDETGQTRHVDRHRENVVQVHLDRVRRALLADAEGGGGRRRRQDRIDALREDPFEIALDQRADLLRADIVSVVIARRQDIGADHQPPPNLGAEAAGARLFVELRRCRRRARASRSERRRSARDCSRPRPEPQYNMQAERDACWAG